MRLLTLVAASLAFATSFASSWSVNILPPLPNGSTMLGVAAVSPQGTYIVVKASRISSDRYYLYHPGDRYVDLSGMGGPTPLADEPFSGRFTMVNDNGDLVGFTDQGAPFFYEPGSHRLTPITAPNAAEVHPTDVDASGSVVGVYKTGLDATKLSAFSWQGGTFKPLTLPVAGGSVACLVKNPAAALLGLCSPQSTIFGTETCSTFGHSDTGDHSAGFLLGSSSDPQVITHPTGGSVLFKSMNESGLIAAELRASNASLGDGCIYDVKAKEFRALKALTDGFHSGARFIDEAGDVLGFETDGKANNEVFWDNRTGAMPATNLMPMQYRALNVDFQIMTASGRIYGTITGADGGNVRAFWLQR